MLSATIDDSIDGDSLSSMRLHHTLLSIEKNFSNDIAQTLLMLVTKGSEKTHAATTIDEIADRSNLISVANLLAKHTQEREGNQNSLYLRQLALKALKSFIFYECSQKVAEQPFEERKSEVFHDVNE